MARKILLADDSVTAQNMGRKILSDAGYEVTTVNNGSAAIKKISEQRPDLIVLDVYMPGYSGLEVCQRLKETGETSRIPVLLTVGKLEPFKPEEAKRVRADAFIVKPFEASELLSALTKLEDRIVPRAEPSKPGRFARAIAAVEESSRNEAVADDPDSGWKNRISFPSKNKKKVEEEEEQEAQAAAKKGARAPEVPSAPMVELAVTEPPALPKDVTPEELAELAAAVAQVQAKHTAGVIEQSSEALTAPRAEPAKVEEAKVAEGSIAPAPTFAAKMERPPVAEVPVEVPAHTPAVSFGDARAEQEYQDEVQREAAALAKDFEKVGAKAEPKPAAAAESRVEEVKIAASQPEQGKAAEAKVEEVKVVEAKAVEMSVMEATFAAVAPPETARVWESSTPNHADMIAAIAALEPANGKSWDASLAAPAASEREHEEPVALAAAAAAGAGSASTRSHWTAVPVALDHDEASMSLEREMEKAYAAMVAAESVPAPSAAAVAPAAEAQPTPMAEAETVAAVPAVSVAPSEPGATSIVSEQMAPPVPAPPEPVAAEPIVAAPVVRQHESVLAHALSAVANAVKEAVGIVRHEAPSAGDGSLAAVEIPQGAEVSPSVENSVAEAKTSEVAKVEESAVPAAAVETKSEIPTPEAAAQSAGASEHNVQQSQTAAESAPSPAESSAVRSDSAAGGQGIMSDRESQAAAAWASWRQIRDTQKPGSASSPKSKQEDDDEDEYPAAATEPAAMAAAAGAEKAPEETAEKATNPDAIASIVDSVLADLRPKIVAEISKKLNEKK